MSAASETGASAEPGWGIVIPVKPATIGKSRLVVDGVDRVALSRAIALDTVAAAAAASAVEVVVVVTEDSLLPMLAADVPGLRFVPEGETRGLNEAIAEGMRVLDAMHPSGERMPRAALLGDLPALRPSDLDAALAQAADASRAVVADAEGTGSTLVTIAPGLRWESHFGPNSYAAHVAHGCIPLDVPASSTLRHDVDTAAQLDAARTLGLGPRTAALLG